MIDTTTSKLDEIRARRAATDDAHYRSTRAALLEHARMGRSVPQGGPGNTVIWIPPAEIFARYGFDEFGRPLPEATPPA
jgi:hypothetical protein